MEPDTHEGLRSTLQARNEELAGRAGESHVQRPQSYAADRFHGYPAPFPDAKDDPDKIYFTMVDNPYAPCVASIDELEPVVLSELVMGSHHRGKFLLVKLERNMGCGRLFVSACVRDSQSDVECLSLSFVCMNEEVGHYWPHRGEWFAIKEPHLTLHEMGHDPYIRVEHPSDLVEVACLPHAQLTRAVFSDLWAVPRDELPSQCKEEGNSALANGDVEASLKYFTKGLQRFQDVSGSESPDVRKDLLRNRAYVRFKLGQYEGAIADAIASLSNETPDQASDQHKTAKAYLHAGQASYALGEYDAAVMYYRKLLALQRDHVNAAHLLSKTEVRLRECNSGIYDMTAIRNSVSGKKPRVDAANYLSNITIKPSAHSQDRRLLQVGTFQSRQGISSSAAGAYGW